MDDNVYFTLRDVYLNSKSLYTALDANQFNKRLTGGISFEYFCDTIQYTNKLYERVFIEELLRWLNNFNIHYFEFEQQQIEDDKDINLTEYIKFDDWWQQFGQLKSLLQQQLEKCIQWEEDVERDCNRQCELEEEYNSS